MIVNDEMLVNSIPIHPSKGLILAQVGERWYVKPEVSGSRPSPVKVYFAIFWHRLIVYLGRLPCEG